VPFKDEKVALVYGKQSVAKHSKFPNCRCSPLVPR
jgi:hypothetical protein